MEKKDFSKLRPFDLVAARDRGEAAIIVERDEEFGFVAGPNNLQEYVLCGNESGFIVVGESPDHATTISSLRMAPLAWVRKSADEDVLWPVYKGDRLYWVTDESWIVAHEFVPAGQCIGKNGAIKNDDGPLSDVAWLENLTFTPPKVKREGWVNVYRGGDTEGRAYASKEKADNAALNRNRVACILIEWEEPA